MDLIKQLDFSTLNFMEQIRAPILTVFFKAITVLGEWNFVLSVLFFISLFFIIIKTSRFRLAARRNLDVFILWAVTIGGFGTAFILKEFFHRSRPIGALVAESSSSFPSLHAIISISFYFLLAYLIAQETKKRILKYTAIIVGVVIVLLLGFSRLYLGVHYLSDVLAGYAIGDIWFLIGVYLLNKTSRLNLATRFNLDVFSK